MAQGWLSDNIGRIQNISLAPNAKNALFPLFEAVMNSIHAIEERFGPDNLSQGRIEITVHRDKDGGYVGFTTADNGIGFTPDNLISFQKFDSQKKAKIGGKGVGRLLWLKVAHEARIRSYHSNETGKTIGRYFSFTIENPFADYKEEESSRPDIGTTVEINPFKGEYAVRLPKKLDTIANRLIAHFVSYFTNISHPDIVLTDGIETINLLDIFTKKIERDRDFTFEAIEIEFPFIIHCFLLPKNISDDEKSVNALYLGANGRAVSRYELDSVLGMKAINGEHAFLGYVESKFLNRNVNDTRTAFSLDDDQLSTIIDAAKIHVREFLEPEIQEIRKKQTAKIVEIGREYPRFFYAARNASETAERLHLATQSEEEIFVELSRGGLRDYKRRKKNYNNAYQKALPDVAQQTENFMQRLKQDATSSLAEYVARRRAILEIFEAGLRFKDPHNDTSHYEKVVHGIICPLSSTSQELTYENHNLWLLDDRLSFYTYFNSDKRMDKQAGGEGASADRTDITLFDLGLGFQSDDASQPITIIEFKRPKRDDYTLTDNPISQVRSYVDQLRRSQEALKFDGTPLRAISADTPFTCHIVADITPSLQHVMKQLTQFSQRAGTSSFYCWDSNYRIFIEISSFREILSSAKARNHAFFKYLGLD